MIDEDVSLDVVENTLFVNMVIKTCINKSVDVKKALTNVLKKL